MIFNGLGSWDDVLLWHYIVAVLTSFVVVGVTFLFCLKSKYSRVADHRKNSETRENESCDDSSDVIDDSKYDQASASEDSEDLEAEDRQQFLPDGDVLKDIKKLKRPIKKSPALIAEHVIKANMTEEQKNFEQEICRKQLSEIFQLMQKENEKFGQISLSEVEEQMKLYH